MMRQLQKNRTDDGFSDFHDQDNGHTAVGPVFTGCLLLLGTWSNLYLNRGPCLLCLFVFCFYRFLTQLTDCYCRLFLNNFSKIVLFVSIVISDVYFCSSWYTPLNKLLSRKKLYSSLFSNFFPLPTVFKKLITSFVKRAQSLPWRYYHCC